MKYIVFSTLLACLAGQSNLQAMNTFKHFIAAASKYKKPLIATSLLATGGTTAAFTYSKSQQNSQSSFFNKHNTFSFLSGALHPALNHTKVSKEPVASRKTVTLGSAETINMPLRAAGLTHFVEKTNIGKGLEGKELYPIGVYTHVNLKIHDYIQYCINSGMSEEEINGIKLTMNGLKIHISACILKDSPEALNELLADLNKISNKKSS